MRISDWSSDVCSSDLYYNAIPGPRPAFRQVFRIFGMDRLGWLVPWEFSPTLVAAFLVAIALFVRGQRVHRVDGEIGIASCRESVWPYVSISVAAVSLTNKQTLSIQRLRYILTL